MTWWKKNRFLLLLLTLGFPFFFFSGPGYYSVRSFKAAWDLGHILFFSLAAPVLLSLYYQRDEEPKALVVFLRVFVIVLCCGIAVELLQEVIGGRSTSLSDVFRNQVGMLVGSAAFFSRHRLLSGRSRRLLQVSAGLLLLYCARPFAAAVIDEQRAAAQFPVLAEFENSLELSRWRDTRRLSLVHHPVRRGNGALRVQLTTSKYSGVSLFYFPHDWSGYRRLHFSVYNPLPTLLKLQTRIHDAQHADHGRVFRDRFNKGFELQPGWNDLQISLADVKGAPEGREMDMHNIRGFGMFVVRQPRSLVIFLDNVYLGN